jgi:hypothetical protein
MPSCSWSAQKLTAITWRTATIIDVKFRRDREPIVPERRFFFFFFISIRPCYDASVAASNFFTPGVMDNRTLPENDKSRESSLPAPSRVRERPPRELERPRSWCRGDGDSPSLPAVTNRKLSQHVFSTETFPRTLIRVSVRFASSWSRI